MRVNVLCMKWGTKYGSEYVNRLYEGVRRNLSLPFRFVCLTDRTDNIDSRVETLGLPDTPFDERALDVREGCETYRKVGVFQPGLAGLEGETLFLDLDVAITGPLDDLFTYEPGRFCVIHDWLEKRRAWQPGRDGRIGNTSVFRFTPGQQDRAYEYFAANQASVLDRFRIEQQYISDILRDDLVFWPSRWVCSFKRNCRPAFPLNLVREPYQPTEMRVLVFHGEPLPDQAIAGHDAGLLKSTRPATWLQRYWQDAA